MHYLKLAVVSLFIFTQAFAATYHLSPTGSDAGTGSATSPWQTIEHARTQVTGGDSLLLADGSYDGWDDYNLRNLPVINDWVTVRPAPGATASITRVHTGHWKNDLDRYLRFEDLTVDSLVELRHAVHLRFTDCYLRDGIDMTVVTDVDVQNCLIERYGPFVLDQQAMTKTAVAISGTDIRVEGCEVTNGAVGIGAKGDSIIIKDNHVHHLVHDGLRIVGVRHGLVEGNEIHDLDDGVDDKDSTFTYAGTTYVTDDPPFDWNFHVDGIHVFITGAPCSVAVPNYDVTFRGNLIYDVKGQNFMFNILSAGSYKCPDVHNQKLVFENNIFGPCELVCFNMASPVDTVVFRNNTMVYFPEGRNYTSQFRTENLDGYNFAIDASCTEIYVYNNLMVNTYNGAITNFCDNNLSLFNGQNHPLGRFGIVDPSEHMLQPDSIDGILLPTSAAVDAGTRDMGPPDDVVPDYHFDFYGTPRDARPDIGAYEVPGNDPAPEPQPYAGSEEKTVFVDDFADGNFRHDIWLDTVNTRGLSWTQATNDTGDYEVWKSRDLVLNAAAAPKSQGPTWLFADIDRKVKSYDMKFTATNPGLLYGDGPMVLYTDTDNFYHVDISKETGGITRTLDGVKTVLDTSDAIETDNRDAVDYIVYAVVSPDSINIGVDKGGDGWDLEYVDTDPSAVAAFASGGGIGLHHFYDGFIHHRVSMTDFRIEVTVFGDTLVSSVTVPQPNTQTPWVTLSSNVVFDRLTVYADGATLVSIHDAAGKELARNRRGQTAFTWDTAGMARGVYYVRVMNSETATIHKVLIP